MIELTAEQQQALDGANGSPPVVIDRRTGETYVLVRTAVNGPFSRVIAEQPVAFDIPEGIRCSRAALRQALPELLARRRYRGKWVCYHRDERIGIGSDYAALIGECNRRGIGDGDYTIERIEPNAGDETEEEFDRCDV